jgi:hypothetical protein
MPRRVADFGFFLIWRPGFGAPRQRRRIRHGGRCEPEHGRADDRRQPKLVTWCGRFLASHPEDHGDRRDRRGGHRTRWIKRSDPRLAGPMLRCLKQGIKTAANQLAHAGTPARESVARGRAWGLPEASNRSAPHVPKNKTLRERAF